ncbi:MAG: SDR family oxidoreductase [Bacteroidales bacterium]|nr:SDR family oxidoreductase [Bacteroidales bacterium]
MTNIIITGCSRGIGKELVKIFAKNNQNRIIGISRTPQISDNENIHYLSFDLMQIENQSEILFQKIQSICESVDILINNAGLLVNKNFESVSYKEAYEMVYLNYIAPAWLIRLLLPLLKKSHKPHVVNISSMGGFQGSSKYKGLAWYSSSKAAIASLTECLAIEFAEYNISTNCLALGAVNTEMLWEAFPGYQAPVEPDKIAMFIADFAQNAHHVMNGKIVPVALSNP